jgi:hypothetical protein
MARHVHGTSTALRLLAASLIMLAHPACKTQGLLPDWALETRRPETALETFSHELHKGAFERNDIQCFACHTMAARIDDAQEAADAIRASKAAFRPGKEQCHVCHYNPAAGNTAPDRCGLCHLDPSAVAPPNHNFDWIKRHAVFAKADNRCEECHRPRFCEECHSRRDQTTRTFHDRNVRFVHGIEARANPMKCGQCHTPNFCESCHVKGGYER